MQGSQEWLQWRKGKITASIISGMMGLNPWCSQLETWEKFQFELKTPVNEAMERGSRLEPIARDKLNLEGGYAFKPVCIQHDSISWMAASLDGFYLDLNGKPHACEIKCPTKGDTHAQAIFGLIPHHYYPQCQWILMLLDADDMIYYSFDGENGAVVLVKKDVEFIERMTVEAHAFKRSIDEFKAPAATLRKNRMVHL